MTDPHEPPSRQYTDRTGGGSRDEGYATNHGTLQYALAALGIGLFIAGIVLSGGGSTAGDAAVSSDDDPFDGALQPQDEETAIEENSPSSDRSTETTERANSGESERPIGDGDSESDATAVEGPAGDGGAETPEPTRIIEIESTGEAPVAYEIVASGGIGAVDRESAGGLDDRRVDGELAGGTHTFEFGGNVTNLVVDGEAVVYIDGRLVLSTDETGLSTDETGERSSTVGYLDDPARISFDIGRPTRELFSGPVRSG
ncbi:hypothetical protein ACNS7O_17845 (plasmid) [Haloferacaceae archaeon DSL9]